MAQSFCNLLYHLVFSTKTRKTWLKDDVRSQIHQYLGGAVKGEGGTALIVNGTDDHVHILAKLRQDKALSDVIRSIKANSSGWIHRTFERQNDFAWQSGYGAFSVSTSQVEKVRSYVANQEEHHRRTTFQEEFLALLDAHHVEYDARYVFD